MVMKDIVSRQDTTVEGPTTVERIHKGSIVSFYTPHASHYIRISENIPSLTLLYLDPVSCEFGTQMTRHGTE